VQAAELASDELELLGAEGEGLDLGEGPDGARGEREVGGGLGVERPGEQLLPAEVPLLELAGPGCRSLKPVRPPSVVELSSWPRMMKSISSTGSPSARCRWPRCRGWA